MVFRLHACAWFEECAVNFGKLVVIIRRAENGTQHRLYPGGQRRLGNFGAYGGTIPTPRIDRCAAEGIRFNNYNVEIQCTPTRSAILTGRHPVRSGTSPFLFPGKGNPGWPIDHQRLLGGRSFEDGLKGGSRSPF
jgi:hypothetical protein